MGDVPKAKSGGGAATSGGTTFQEDVACYLSTLILAESNAEPPTGLPQGVTLSSIVAETSQPIDDLLVGTSAGGVLLFQSKTALSLSEDSESEFAKVIDQFVRQRVAGVRPVGGTSRPPEAAHDRFVLAVGHDAPGTITATLVSVLDKCRPISDGQRLAELPDSLNAKEKEALACTRAHIQRSWTATRGLAPTALEELSVLHLMHVLQLDLRVDGAEFTRAKDLLRHVVLATPERSGDAWNALVAICRTFGPDRTGGDLPFLRQELQAHEIPIRSVPSFADDIDALRKYTSDRVGFLHRLSEMRLGGQRIKITREVANALVDFAEAGHTAVIGEPGAGKSGCVHDLAAHFLGEEADVVLLAADMVHASSPEALAADLGLSRSRGLVDVLQSWSGDRDAFLLVDALDAARSGMSLHVLCQVLQDVQERAPRWHIVASIREYDLRTSSEVQDLLAGSPHPQFKDQRFPKVRHVRIARLSTTELSQVTNSHPRIGSAIAAAPALGALVKNPFNLNLLCKLLDNNVSNADLSAVQTQVGLLDLYWTRRVEAEDRSGRLVVLGKAVEQMVAARSLHVSRQSLSTAVAANVESLDGLLSDGVLVELALKPLAPSIVGFAHNILFDYAVCSLWLQGLDDAIVAKLSEPQNHDLLLAIRPSITMAFEELWFADDTRAAFWQRASAFERAAGMRLIGKIIAASVAAEEFRHVGDVEPLLQLLQQKQSSGAALLRFTIQAAVTQQDAGPGQRSLIGPNAPDWMGLAEKLTEYLDQVPWEVRSLIWPMTRGASAATESQARSANKAAVALLRFGLDSPRFHNVVRPALEVAASTIGCDPEPTVNALASVLRDENLTIGAHEWLHPLAERLALIAKQSPEFAIDIVDVVFAASGDRDAAVPMGGRILPLTMNKHDLVRMARHDVQEGFRDVWQHDPVTGTRIVLRVMNATMEEEHANLTEPTRVYTIPFRGADTTLKPDASHIWTAGEHNRHDEWYQVLSTFQAGLKDLAKRDQAVLSKVLDTLRDEAELAVIWSAVLEAASEEPEHLGIAVSELLASSEVLSAIDTRKSAGDLIEHGFLYFSLERRRAIEAAILQIPEATPEELHEYAEHGRNRMLGCIPPELIESPELRKIRTDLDSSGGPPPNEPDFSISTSWGGGDDDWWLRRQGVEPEKPENTELLKLSKDVKAIPGRKPPEQFHADAAAKHLPLLQQAVAAVAKGRSAGADTPLIDQVEDEIIDACERLTTAQDLKRDTALTKFIRDTLRRGATSTRPEYREEDNDQWDKDSAGWGSPSPRVDAALGLLRLAADPATVDAEILADVARLSEDPVPAVRFQVISHCGWLYRTAPDFMWTLISRVCESEPRTAVLTFFCDGVVLRLPPADYQRLEPLVRKLYRRCRKNDTIRAIRRSCATFYTRGALWRGDSRANRYMAIFAGHPHELPVESNMVVDLCRELIRYNEADSAEENTRVRKWAFSYLTRLVKAILAHANTLREKHGGKSLDQWPREDFEDLRQLHQLAHNVATELYIGSGAFGERRSSRQNGEEERPPTEQEKAQLLSEGKELFDALCDIEFVESAYDVLQTLEFLIGVDHAGIILRVAALVRRAERDGIQYESMAADLVVRIVERYLAEYGTLFRETAGAREALLDILDVFVSAGWPGATRLTYRLGEVFR